MEEVLIELLIETLLFGVLGLTTVVGISLYKESKEEDKNDE